MKKTLLKIKQKFCKHNFMKEIDPQFHKWRCAKCGFTVIMGIDWGSGAPDPKAIEESLNSIAFGSFERLLK